MFAAILSLFLVAGTPETSEQSSAPTERVSPSDAAGAADPSCAYATALQCANSCTQGMPYLDVPARKQRCEAAAARYCVAHDNQVPNKWPERCP